MNATKMKWHFMYFADFLKLKWLDFICSVYKKYKVLFIIDSDREVYSPPKYY